MKTEIMDAIAKYASQNYEHQVINSLEYAEFVKNITKLQDNVRQLNLPEEQLKLIKQLLKEYHDLSLYYVEKLYKQAKLDCVVLLKELKFF